MTQENARYSIEEVNNMHPFEIGVYSMLIKEQIEKQEAAKEAARNRL
jgi:hypothetical protein